MTQLFREGSVISNIYIQNYNKIMEVVLSLNFLKRIYGLLSICKRVRIKKLEKMDYKDI